MAKKKIRDDSDFYSGIVTALYLLDLHGEDTIYKELVDTCDLKGLIEYAKKEGEIEFSGLARHGYIKERPQ